MYIYNEDINVWVTTLENDYSYNDGDEIENALFDNIKESHNKSYFSEELNSKISSFASFYHLTPTRGNLLRPFLNKLRGASVLEIGCGCGAITRFLGEENVNVTALEGSLRRAKITGQRVLDLPNVKVIADTFEHFNTDDRFEFITLIGVLEYAPMFSNSPDAVKEMLNKIKSFLKPHGKIIIAIENQLGLKYFAGAPEDHLGKKMYGIENKYKKNDPTTYGRKVLRDLLMASGLTSTFYAPYPDYKFPSLILSEEAFGNTSFDISKLVKEAIYNDPQLPDDLTFNLFNVFQTVNLNNLGMELSNSFLIEAQVTKLDGLSFLNSSEDTVLAYYYNIGARKKQYSKSLVFNLCKKNNMLSVLNDVSESDVKTSLESVHNNEIIQLNKEKKTNEVKYINGENLNWNYIGYLISLDDIFIEDIADCIHQYLLVLAKMNIIEKDAIDHISTHTKINSCFFDAIPRNIIKLRNEYVLIDQEWTIQNELTVGYLIFRAILDIISTLSRFSISIKKMMLSCTYDFFFTKCFNKLNIPFCIDNLNKYIKLEHEIRNQIYIKHHKNISDWLWTVKKVKNVSYSKLYYSMTEKDFSEDKVLLFIIDKLDKQDKKLNYNMLSNESGFLFFRWDPLENIAGFSIKDIIITINHLDQTVSSISFTKKELEFSNILNEGENILISCTCDPQIILPPINVGAGELISVSINFYIY